MDKDRFSELHKSFDCFKLHRQPIVVKLKRRKSQCAPDVSDLPDGGLQPVPAGLGSSGVRD